MRRGDDPARGDPVEGGQHQSCPENCELGGEAGGCCIGRDGHSLLQQDGAALTGRTYSYDPAGRRDPFRSLLVRPEDRARGDRPLGVPGMSIDDIAIYGIWKTRSGYIAQVRATDNKSYLIRAGDLLYDGEVTRVGPNEVVFRQNINDPQSVKPFREVTKQLNVTPKP